MKVNEVVSGFTKRYIASVRCEVAGMGTTTALVGINADSATSAKFLLSRLYGRANVMGVQEVMREDDVIDESGMKPITSQEQIVNSLVDQSKQLGVQAKKVKAQQGIQKAQAKLAKINQSSISSGIG